VGRLINYIQEGVL